MNCAKSQQWLPMLADCLLTPEQQSQLEAHLAQCPSCRKEAQTYQQIAEHCCHLSQVEIPEDFYGRLAQRLRAECRQPEVKTWHWQTPLLISGVSAAAAFLAVWLIHPPHLPVMPEAPKSLLAGIATHSPVAKLAPLLNPRPAAPEHPAVLTEAKGSVLPEMSSHTVEEKSMMASSAFVPSAPTSAPVTPQALLQDAAFTPGAQFVPAYTLPQTGAVNPENSEDASLLARLTSALPAQQRSETSVARSSLELQALLAKSQQTKPLFTELDWEKQMLAAVFLNPTEAAGYRLQLNDIVQMSDKILIQYSVLRPVTVLPAFEAAPPALFVVLPFSPLPVEFQEK